MERGYQYYHSIESKGFGGTLDELQKFCDKYYPQVKKGDTWGNWKLVGDFLCYRRKGMGEYAICLRELDSSAEFLDWIYQLKKKGWTTPDDIWNLLHALDEIFNVQGSVCSSGCDRKFSPVKDLKATKKQRR